MRQSNIQIKTIPTTNLDPQTRLLIKEAGQGKIRVVLEDEGEPVAAIMPLASVEEWEDDREAFFATFDQAAERADLSEEEAMELALEAVRAVRSRSS